MSIKSSNIKPLGDKILVESLFKSGQDKKTKTGIFIPETTEKAVMTQGKVIAIGNAKSIVKKGQVVVFTEYSADKIEVENVEYHIVSEKHILAVIE